MAFYTSNAFAQNTKRTYRTHKKSYLEFCRRMGYAPVPASSATICRYAAHLAKSLKFNSINQYLNIVRLFHDEWNLPNPLQYNVALSCTLKGIKMHKGKKLCAKNPELLCKILGNLDLSVSLDATVWAVCLTMFYGLLRKSNVLVSRFDKDKDLRRSDILFFQWGVMPHFRWSKVNQFRSLSFMKMAFSALFFERFTSKLRCSPRSDSGIANLVSAFPSFTSLIKSSIFGVFVPVCV